MKNHFTTIAFLIITALSAHAQTKFAINKVSGQAGSLPVYTSYSPADLITPARANQVFKFVKDSSDIEFAYSYAGCEKRAHAISLLLKGKKIPHRKIWNFDPGIVSLFFKSEQPRVVNKTKLCDSVSWAYHVAIVLFVQQPGRIDTAVVDPAIADSLLSYKQWLALQYSPHSFYTFTNPEWYSFVTTDQVIWNNPQRLPGEFPHLVTGGFWLNTGPSLTGLWVEEALAVNREAVKMIADIINDPGVNTAEKNAFKALISNFDNLTNALKGTQIPATLNSYLIVLQPYQQDFAVIRDNWKAKLAGLR